MIPADDAGDAQGIIIEVATEYAGDQTIHYIKYHRMMNENKTASIL